MGLGAFLALVIAVSVSVGGQRANAAPSTGAVAWPSRATTRSSRLIHHRRLVCTAVVTSPVRVGHVVRVRFTVRNRSRRRVKIYTGIFSRSFVLTAADGTTYDTFAPYEALPGIPPPFPRMIRPGRTFNLGSIGVAVRWPGPLVIKPSCLNAELPPLRVQVEAPWTRPDPTTAVAEVVGSTGHLFDHCLPQTSGVPVVGQIDAPRGAAPPMDAQCSITISSEGPFSVAQVLVLIPADLSGVQVYQPYETLWPIDHFAELATPPPYEAIAWEFVVTPSRAIPLAASEMSATNSSKHSVPSFSWNGKKWKSDGGSSCGGYSYSWGGTSPEIEFISACSG